MKLKISILALALTAHVAVNAMSPMVEAQKSIAAGDYDKALNIIDSRVKGAANKSDLLVQLVNNNWNDMSDAQQQRIEKMSKALPEPYQTRIKKHPQENLDRQIRNDINNGEYGQALRNIDKVSNDENKAKYLSMICDRWEEVTDSHRRQLEKIRDSLPEDLKAGVNLKIERAENARRKAQIGQLQKQIAPKKQKLAKLEAELNDHLQTFEKNAKNLSKVRRDLDNAKRDGKSDEVAELNKQMKKLRDFANQLQREEQMYRKNIDELEKDIHELETEINKARNLEKPMKIKPGKEEVE